MIQKKKIFFSSQILEVGPKEGLARFGYRLERKVEKLRILLYMMATC
jgi:hypothetical protein